MKHESIWTEEQKQKQYLNSYPKKRPVCCGHQMYAAGGVLSERIEDTARFWRCEICNSEIEDRPLIEVETKTDELPTMP